MPLPSVFNEFYEQGLEQGLEQMTVSLLRTRFGSGMYSSTTRSSSTPSRRTSAPWTCAAPARGI